MLGHSSYQDPPPPPAGDRYLRHATAVQSLPSQQQHNHQQRSPKQAAPRPRSSFLEKADSLLLAKAAPTQSRPTKYSYTSGPATLASPLASLAPHGSSASSNSNIYLHPPPRRSRPSPAFAPRLPAASSSPVFESVSPVIRQVSNHSESSSSSDSSAYHSHYNNSHDRSSLISPPSSPPSSLPPLLPPRSRLRPQSTVENSSTTRSNPLESFPPPAPPKPAHYNPNPHHYRRPPLSPPPALPIDDHAPVEPSPPPYTSKLASLARALSPPLPPLPLNTAAVLATPTRPRKSRPSNNPPLPSTPPPESAKMVSGGRVVCVALPFVLAVVSIVAFLVAALAGVTEKSLYMFEVNTTGLSISPSDAASVLSGRAPDNGVAFHDFGLIPGSSSGSGSSTGSKATTTAATSGSNITAADLNLGKLYDFSLWNYCETQQNGTRTCSHPEFDWAAKQLNASESSVKTLISSTGVNVQIPKAITDAINTFGTLARWTQIVFFIAFGALVLEILVGLFTSCSRGIACLTWVISGFTIVAVVAAAGLATAMSLVVVGVLEADAKKYGVTASVNGGFLAAVWIAAAAAIAASFFWMFTICCCAPSHRSRSGPGPAPRFNDKMAPAGAYQPLNDPHLSTGAYGYNNQYGAPRQQGGRSDLAYEPYSHSNV